MTGSAAEQALALDVELVFGAIATGRATDEVTGGPPLAPVLLTSGQLGVRAKSLPDGSFALTGVVRRALPRLAEAPTTFEVELRARGYRPHTLTITVPRASALPLRLSPVALRPLPVRIEGRVVRSETDRTAVARARVRSVNLTGQRLLSLRTPIAGVHAVGAPVRSRPLTMPGPTRRLTATAESGARLLKMDNATGLASGAVLALDWRRATEFVVLDGPATLTGAVPLRVALVRTFPAGTEVLAAVIGGGGASRQLVRSADPGDGLLVLNAALSAQSVEIGDPTTSAVEYRAVGAITDAKGFYALNGIGGVRAVALAPTLPGSGTGPTVTADLDYTRGRNVIDLELAP